MKELISGNLYQAEIIYSNRSDFFSGFRIWYFGGEKPVIKKMENPDKSKLYQELKGKSEEEIDQILDRFFQ